MYIVAIAWLYVVTLMSVLEKSIFAGVMTFFWYGLAPLSLVLWLFGTPERRRRRARKEAASRSEAQPPAPEEAPSAERESG
ncbi:MAG: hypothetical protein M0T84_03685 [Betaproteobacteria bacterium]|nr:hypothetical protein [Betaproteobacteria bacterium]